MATRRTHLFMGTTTVPAQRTSEEIQKLLVSAGATQVACDYSAGKVIALRFTLTIAGVSFAYQLPARTGAVLRRLMQHKPYKPSGGSLQAYEQRIKEEGERVGWRQLLRWLEAQLAMIDAGMVTAHEVFFPYLLGPDGRQTAHQAWEESTLKLIEAPKSAVR